MDQLDYYKNIFKTGKLPFNGIVSIELTNKCNLSCSMCFYKKKGTLNKELSSKDFINFLNTTPNLSAVYFMAREPLMKEGFFDIVALLKKKNIPMLLLTNGTLIDGNNYPSLIYRSDNIIMLSVDGDKKTHDKIRGIPGCFDKVISAAKLLANKCDLRIVSTINDENIDSLFKIPKIINEIGLKEITFEYARKYSRVDIEKSIKLTEGNISLLSKAKNVKPAFSIKRLTKNIDKMENRAKQYKVKVNYLPTYFKKGIHNIYERKMRKNHKLTCRYLSWARIDQRGNFIHCFAFRKSFGNISKDSLIDVWGSNAYVDFRKKLLRNNLMPVCETCWGAIPKDK